MCVDGDRLNSQVGGVDRKLFLHPPLNPLQRGDFKMCRGIARVSDSEADLQRAVTRLTVVIYGLAGLQDERGVGQGVGVVPSLVGQA